jgi:tRNA threonylcarbamoyl adenosine modification protein (Sua5/YciO/YrdC/YwlC family)
VAAALDALQRGLVVGLPTDTVYGIGVDPWNESALDRLFALKRRPAELAVPILAGDLNGVGRLAVMTGAATVAANRHWPGPLTMVLHRVPGLPDWIGNPERDTIGVRIPGHPIALELLRSAGPLAVTSANLSGEPPARNDRQAADVLGAGVAVYLAGDAAGGAASTVVDLSGAEPVVLREGPIRWEYE